MKNHLIYINTNTDEVSLIDVFDDIGEAYKCIRDFNDKIGFKSYYIRTINFDDFCKIDFGSYTRFYYIALGEVAANKLIERLKRQEIA